MDDSAITCDEIIDTDTEAKLCNEAKSRDEETKAFSTNCNEKNITCKIQNFYLLLAFLLINVALLIINQRWLLVFAVI